MALALHIVLCSLLGAAILALAAYRKTLTVDEDHPLHLSGGASPVVQNPAVERRLELIDRSKMILTIILVVYGLALIGSTLYLEWNRISS